MTFEKFTPQWVISGDITMETPLRIGTSTSPASLSGAPVLLQYDAGNSSYSPFIPGSSLKGVLRATAERILRTHEMDIKMVEKIFGSENAGAKIKVRDSHPSVGMPSVKERPHYTSRYKLKSNENKYFIDDKGRGGFRAEEVISPVSFSLKVEMDDATEEEVSLILKALDEIEHKRVFIGGGSSRGTGFASVKIDKLSLKVLDGWDLTQQDMDAEVIEAKLRLNSEATERNEKDFPSFDHYAWAWETKTLNGTVVCEMAVICESDFKMSGIDEPTVMMMGRPIIPGSVIKGFLKKSFIKKWNKDWIDQVFGGKNHRSRVSISDAFSDTLNTEDHIPAGTELKCWILFDNMKEEHIIEILKHMNDSHFITGSTSAKGGGDKKIYNKAHFELADAWKYTLGNPVYDVYDIL